MKLLITR